jgi:NhaP-type Na+/H+ or K+/H+ antiporter
MSDAVIVVGVVVVFFALAAERLGRTVITGPMVFTAIGLLIGPKGADLVDLKLDSDAVELLLTTALATVLFVDATHVKVRALRSGATTPARLLLIGFPAMLVVGLLAGITVFPGVSLIAVAALATVLAPTDAALGQAVISNPEVPLGIRQSLSVESGLNDGLALPVLFTVLTIGQAEEADQPVRVLLEHLAKELGFGLLAGVVIGVATVLVIRGADRVGLAPSPSAVGLASFGALGVTVGLSVNLGGSLMIGAFVAGLVIGPTLSPRGPDAYVFGENAAEVLTMISFIAFGGVVLSSELDSLTWQIALYAVLSLAVLRPLTVLLATIDSHDTAATVGFLGWFGPRGLASILFVATITSDVPDFPDLATVRSVMTWTVLLSIVAHGLTAWPWSNRYARYCQENRAMMDASPAAKALPADVISERPGSVMGRLSPMRHARRADG